MTAPKIKAATLCIAAFELMDRDESKSNNSVIAAASALHLVHAAALIHERLPLTDRPSLNPNIEPITPHTYDPSIELLTGDGIIPFVFEILAKSIDPAQKNSAQILGVIVEITRPMKSLIYGQLKETKMGEFDGCDDVWIGHVCERKQGGLYACGAASGAILGGGSEEKVERIRKYGFHARMIHGIIESSKNEDVNSKSVIEEVKELRVLALKELEHFKGVKILMH